MKRFTTTLICLIMLIALSSMPSMAADTAPVMTKGQIIDLVKAADNVPATKFLLKETTAPELHGDYDLNTNTFEKINLGGYRTVFVSDSIKYTFDYNYWAEGIQVWWRKDGTSKPKVFASHIGDGNMDGIVEAVDQEMYNKALLALQKTIK